MLVEPEKKEETKTEVKKPFQKPFWTTEDKTYFFEALNEYGKDFEAIHTYINTKLRKKGAPDTALKTREQIRHWYYRTWHRISKHLKFSEDVKKVVQELYGLINYGEMRRKLSSVCAKTCIKLNELIYRGTLAIRDKGRIIRIRTPMCKALRRLNRLEENEDDIKLPTRVLVECMPKDMYTWMKVQEMSQNPRIRILVPLQRRLSLLIYYLSQRWKNSEVIEHEKLLAEGESVISANGSEEPLFSPNIVPRSEPLLRLAPRKEASVVLPTFNITEFFTTQSICLNAYEERISAKQSGEALWLEAFPNVRQLIRNGLNKRGTKRTRTESNSEKGLPPNNVRPGCSTHTDSTENCMAEGGNCVVVNGENCAAEGENTNKVEEFIDEAVNTILSLKQQEASEVVELPELGEPLLADEQVELNDDDCLIMVKKEHDIANIRLGWTLPECSSLTVGDLYLMFGANSKIQLEYSWDECTNTPVIKTEETANPEEVDVKIEDESTNEENKPTVMSCSSRPSVTSSLKQLLSVAKLHYRKNIVKCPCGHICGSPTKSQSKAKVLQKQSRNGCNDNKNTLDIQTSTMVTVLQQSNITTTASMVPVLIQPEIKKFSPQSLFRRPNSPNCGLRAQINSIQRMMPRYCNRKGRHRTKQVVVERKLPLLASKADGGRIMQMNIISQDVALTQPRRIVPQLLPAENVSNQTNAAMSTSTFSTVNLSSADVISTQGSDCGQFQIVQLDQSQIHHTSEHSAQVGIANDIHDNATTFSRVGSPTSISNLLDMALQNASANDGNEGPSEKGDGITNFVGLLSDRMETTPPCSPSRLLKENDHQWINAEVQDFSFSSFLGHLDSSPMKTSQSANIGNSEDTRMSLTHDMDAQLQSLLTESSLDYTAKFADLEALVTDCKK